MTVSKMDMIHEARMAFDANDHRRGGAILHEIFKQDINHTAAWDLLHAALNRSDSLADFQLEFVSKYYPEQAAQFQFETKNGGGDNTEEKPFRRVSLGVTKSAPAKLKPISLVDPPLQPVSETLESRSIDPVETVSKAAPALKTPALETPKKAGLFKRIGSYFSRMIPKRREKDLKRAASADKEVKPIGAEEVPPESMLAPLSLKDLPKKTPITITRPKQVLRKDPKPLLSKLYEERHEIRLIIADDIAQTRDNIRKLLLFEPSVEVVAVAANGQEAIELALKYEPDIVLMDINMPGMDGLEALKSIREQLPLTQVIMLTVQDDPGYLREALQSGARDYLIKPPTIDELLDTIQQTHEIGRAERDRLNRLYTLPEEPYQEAQLDEEGMAIAVYSPKGGVGCTFIAANLAVALQNETSNVVIVDCDLQYGGVGLFFNEQARSSVIDLAPRVKSLDANLLRDAVILNHASGVRMILAPSRPEQAEGVNGEQLAELVRYLRTVYPVVIVDTGCNLDHNTASVLEACDELLYVTTQDIPAINDIRRLLDFSPKIGLPENKISLVLNQFHKRVNIDAAQISSNLKREFTVIIPLDNRTAIPSINRGVPFMTSPESRALPIGVAFTNLGERLRQRQSVKV